MKRIRLVLVIFLLALSNGFIVFFLLTNYNNWDNVLNVEPSTVPTTKTALYTYPPLGIPQVIIISQEGITLANGTIIRVLFAAAITLKYNGTLSEGFPADITATGFLWTEGQQVLSSVQLSYQNARLYQGLTVVQPYLSVPLQNASGFTSEIGSKFLTISWDNQGEYDPMFILNFKNGSSPLTLTLQDPIAHVYGPDIVQQQNASRRTIGIELFVLFAAIVDISAPVLRYVIRSRETNQIQSSSAESETKAQTNQRVQRSKKRRKKEAENDNIKTNQKKDES